MGSGQRIAGSGSRWRSAPRLPRADVDHRRHHVCDHQQPLTTWFLAIYLFSQAETGLSALALKCQIGASNPTAWLMRHKVIKALADRKAPHRLCGALAIDDGCIGGERTGGKRGCGSENKVPIVAAVSLKDKGGPL